MVSLMDILSIVSLTSCIIRFARSLCFTKLCETQHHYAQRNWTSINDTSYGFWIRLTIRSHMSAIKTVIVSGIIIIDLCVPALRDLFMTIRALRMPCTVGWTDAIFSHDFDDIVWNRVVVANDDIGVNKIEVEGFEGAGTMLSLDGNPSSIGFANPEDGVVQCWSKSLNPLLKVASGLWCLLATSR